MADQMQIARPEEFDKIYAATVEKAVHNATVITSTLIFSTLVIVLSDLGNMHTFLARAFVDRSDVSIENLGHDLAASTLVGATLTTRVCERGIPVAIQFRMLPMDFVVLLMRV